jgi:hypothetical protein
MSLILIKTSECAIPDEKLLRSAMSRNINGGCYVLIEDFDGDLIPFTAVTAVKETFEEIIEKVKELKEKQFNNGIMVFFFISGYCPPNKKDSIANEFVFSTECGDRSGIIAFGQGDFKWLKGAGNIGEKNFVNFCNWTLSADFFQEFTFSLDVCNKIVSSAITSAGTNDKFIILSLKDENLSIAHNCSYDEEIGLFASNDEYVSPIDYEEKAYLMYALSAKMSRLEKGGRTPHEIKNKLSLFTDKEIRVVAKKFNIPAYK